MKLNVLIAKSIVIVFLLLLNTEICHAQMVSAVSCPSQSIEKAGSKTTFVYNCNASLTSLDRNTSYTVGIYTDTLITGKQNGNGFDLDYTVPEQRFFAIGPRQGGVPAAVTKDSGKNKVTRLVDNLTGVTSYSFSFVLRYVSFEADVSNTTYVQPFAISVYSNKNPNIIFLGSNIRFITEHLEQISISSPLSVYVTPGQLQVPSYCDTNIITVNIKTNNSWLLQSNLNSALLSGVNLIPVNSNYVKALGTGFNNLASNYSLFSAENIYTNIAQSSPGVFTTGSTDGRTLSSIPVNINYSFNSGNIVKPGLYLSNTTFKLISPY